MTDDLIDRLHNPHFDDLQWPKGLFAECADRIETLEAALREIATSQRSDSEQAFVFKMLARAALAGEKKEQEWD